MRRLRPSALAAVRQIEWHRASIDGQASPAPGGQETGEEAVLDAVKPVSGLRGRPGRRPDKANADTGYDYKKSAARRCINRASRAALRDGVSTAVNAWICRFLIEK